MINLLNKKYFIHFLLAVIIALVLFLIFQTRYAYFENRKGELIRIDKILNEIRICSIGSDARFGCDWELLE